MATKKTSTKKRKKAAKKKTAKRAKKPQHKRKNTNRSTLPGKPGAEPMFITAPHPSSPHGRRPTLTDQVTQELVAYIQAGNYYATAFKAVGLPEATFYSWLERGEKELMRLLDHEKATGEAIEPGASELPYLQFLEAIKKAEGMSEVSAVLKVKSAFGESWQAAMTFLERRFPARWRKQDRMELAGDPEAPIGLNVRVYLPDNRRGDTSRPGGPEEGDKAGKDEPEAT